MSKSLQNSNLGASQGKCDPEHVSSEARKEILPKPGPRKRPPKPDRFESFPDGWYKDFVHALERSAHGERLLRDVMPKCEFRAIGKAAMLFLFNPRCLDRARKKRKAAVQSALRKRARQLSAEIAALPDTITDVTDLNSLAAGQLGNFVTIHQKAEKLDQIKAALARVPEAFNIKRSGVFEGQEWLWLVQECIYSKTGIELTDQELGAIVRAALTALGGRQRYQIVHADTVGRNLRNFERNRPVFCSIAPGPAAVHVIETLPH